MAMLDEIMKNMPEQFRNKTRIEALAKAFAKQMEEVEAVFMQLDEMRSMDTATGLQLDYCGDIVCLSRVESALYCKDVDFNVIDDERYRLFVKYKALRNSTQCTYEEMITGCKLIFNADPIYYSEREEYPASFTLSIGANLSEELINMLSSSAMSIRASGVEPKISYFPKEFFGFSDTNRYALGFGKGKFAMGV